MPLGRGMDGEREIGLTARSSHCAGSTAVLQAGSVQQFERFPERTLVVGLVHRHTSRTEVLEHLQELAALVRSAGGTVEDLLLQERPAPDVAYYLGRGKVEELRERILHEDIHAVVFDDELTPVQVRNLERAWGIKVLDRTGIILHIFAQQARTVEAQVQVELAQLQYLLPRLSRMWTHLSKQVGGIGTRGPGETQLETDRRLIRRRIQHLQRRLREITRQREQRRRGRDQLPRFALVGYTNAGKSTLLNALTNAEVRAEDRLFSTLDTTVRAFRLPSGQRALLSDTVGFLHKLPPHLIACSIARWRRCWKPMFCCTWWTSPIPASAITCALSKRRCSYWGRRRSRRCWCSTKLTKFGSQSCCGNWSGSSPKRCSSLPSAESTCAPCCYTCSGRTKGTRSC